MELSLIWVIAWRELREAIKNKWLVGYTLGFAVLAFALSRASLASSGYSGLGGFGRTAASLVNALLLFVPLLGLSIGASALAGDRERGSLAYLLSQPVSRAEVFLGKALGSGLAVCLALAVGFGLAALVLAAGASGEPGAYLGLLVFSLLLAMATLGLGFLISSLTKRNTTAMGAALLLWLGLVFFADLALIGATLAMRPDPSNLLIMLLINPLQSFKLGAIFSLRSTLDALGAVGQFASFRFGASLPYALAGLLAMWSLLTFGISLAVFTRRRD